MSTLTALHRDNFMVLQCAGLRETVFVQNNHDGTFTRWNYTSIGATRHVDKLHKGVTVRRISGQTEALMLKHFLTNLRKAVITTQRLYATMLQCRAKAQTCKAQ